MRFRNIIEDVTGRKTIDGAGVRLVRVLGSPTVKSFDPFLMGAPRATLISSTLMDLFGVPIHLYPDQCDPQDPGCPQCGAVGEGASLLPDYAAIKRREAARLAVMAATKDGCAVCPGESAPAGAASAESTRSSAETSPDGGSHA